MKTYQNLGASVNSCYPTMLKVFCLQPRPYLRRALDVLNNGLRLETPVRTHIISMQMLLRITFCAFIVPWNCSCTQIQVIPHFFSIKYYFASVLCTTAQFTHRNVATNDTKIILFISNSFQFLIIKNSCWNCHVNCQ